MHIRDEIIKLIPKGIDKILFAPFGDLNMLPLHAILIEEDSYLIEKNETKLHLLEIFGLNINANLVNISACETYLSEVKGADEVLAFERAFLIAGAKSVISTFSTVNVMRTEDFMEILYDKIKKEGGSISKSFQKASIVDIENGSLEWSLFRFTES